MKSHNQNLWIGRTHFLFFPCTLVSLTSEKLTLQRRWGRPQKIDLSQVRRLEVRQHLWDRFCKAGDLLIELHGMKKPLRLRGVRSPYEGWKRIKIAVFQNQQGQFY